MIKKSKIRVADLILIIVSIVLIFFSFIGFLLNNEGDWLTAALLTLGTGGIATLLIMFMIYAKKQTNYVAAMRVLEVFALMIFIALAWVVAIVPVNHAFIAMGSSKQMSGAIDNDIRSLNESKKNFFTNESQNIESAASSIKRIQGTLNINKDDVEDVERTMKLENGKYYASHNELVNLSNDYSERYKEKLENKSFAHNRIDRLIGEANEMKRDVDAGFFFTFPSIAVRMNSLSSQMASLLTDRSKELGIRNLEKNGAKYDAPKVFTDYTSPYEKSEFSTKLYGLT